MRLAGSLQLIAIWLCACAAKQEAGWNEPDILLEGNPQIWKHVPKPKPGDPAPYPPKDHKWKSNKATVVVLVAALRETRCGETLKNFFSKAEFPSRVHIGVVQQNAEGDEDCVAAYCRLMGSSGMNCRHSGNVRMLRMKASEAQGPVFARAQQVKLVQDSDDFCMQVDAHTDAVQDWDRLMLEQWGMTNNEYAVLSTYPTNAASDLGKNANNHWEMPHICEANLGSRGQIANHQASAAANLVKPILAPLWAAGLSFSRCHAERNVPNDSMLKGIFSGEEYSRGARLWTHGYDFYSPTRPWIGTWYGWQKRNRGSWHTKPDDYHYAQERLMTLLKWPGSDQSATALARIQGFALGTRRTLDAYAQFSRVDTQKGIQLSKQCGKLWVPWENDSDVYSEYKTRRASALHIPKPPNGAFKPAGNDRQDSWEEPVHAISINEMGTRGRWQDWQHSRTLKGSVTVWTAVLGVSVLVIVGLLYVVFRVLKVSKKQALS